MDQTTRRRFVSKVSAALAVFGGTATLATAQAQTPASTPFRPARHKADDWLDQIPGKHRIFIDAVTPNGAGEAILFANNLYTTNQSAYGLADSDLAIVICMRHFATPFAFNDTFWSKYGTAAGGMLKNNDPKTQKAPTRNVYMAADAVDATSSLGTTLQDVLKRGTQLAVCDLATHFFAGQLAKGNGGNADALYKEFVASAVPTNHFVAAGVVGVNRAQERGYTLIYAG